MTSTASKLQHSSVSHDADTIGAEGIAKRGNALSKKLTSVLSSSYADTEIRDALRLYDARYGQADSERELDLKYQAQKEVVEANARIIDDFAKVAKQLNRVGTLITTLNQTCTSIRKHVLAARAETAPMLEEASHILSQKHDVEQKQQLLQRFTSHFLLSDADLTTLTSSAEPVNDVFFVVLARTKQIHKDCELLLGYENQRLGLELMEQTTRNLNAGYKKLFNWTLREFKGLDLEDPHISGSIRRSLRALSERPALFQSCLDSFAEARQATVSEAFQKALTDSTTGRGAARAIEFSTHDPLRYIGDMLAWVHSATVSEMEALEGLFIGDADEIGRGLHSGKTADPFSLPARTDEDEREEEEIEAIFDGHAALNSLISRNMAGISHTLTQRITITIRNLRDAVEIYKAYNLLNFYHDMFMKLISHSTTIKVSPEAIAENTILTTLTNLQSQTFKHFETTTYENLHGSVDDEPNQDLSPPPALSETLSQFNKIVQTRGPTIDTTEFAKLYGTLVKPIVDSCSALADSLQGADEDYTSAVSAVGYRLNYTTKVRDTLAQLATGSSTNRISAAEDSLKSAQDEVERLRKESTELLTDTFLSSSGLAELAEFLTGAMTRDSATKKKRYLLQPSGNLETRTNGAATTTEGSELLLEPFAAKLDTFLASALMDAQDELSKLSNREIANSVVRTAVQEWCHEFEEITGQLEDLDEAVERETLARSMGKKVNGESAAAGEVSEGEDENEEALTLREVYPRTLEEVQALLS